MPSKRLEEKLTKENLWIYILSLLSKKDMYGYELRAEVQKRFGFKPGNVTAYRVLYSLKLKGLVEIVAKAGSGRERKYYHITRAGVEELERGKKVLRETLLKL